MERGGSGIDAGMGEGTGMSSMGDLEVLDTSSCRRSGVSLLPVKCIVCELGNLRGDCAWRVGPGVDRARADIEGLSSR